MAQRHLSRAALDEAARQGSVYQRFSQFLAWRKEQPAFMHNNEISDLSGDAHEIVFERKSDQQVLRCRFNFETLSASFEEV